MLVNRSVNIAKHPLTYQQLETDACAHTWEQVIAHASELYDSLESYWSQLGKPH